MEGENTVFSKGNKEFNEVWKNKEFFPLLKENGEDIDTKLKSVNIKRVICFDEIGMDWKQWAVKDVLTLAVLPICNIVDQDGKETKDLLKKIGMKIKEKYYPIDIKTNEENKNVNFVVYFPTRNIVISLVNPFYDNTLWENVYADLQSINLEYMDEKEVWKYKLEHQWLQTFNKKKVEVVNRIIGVEDNIERKREDYFDKVQELKTLQQEEKALDQKEQNVGEFINSELEKIKSLPVIRSLTIQDKIYVSFGTVYLHGKVVTAIKEEEGIDVPICELKKVEIGELMFEIGSGEVKVRNDRSVDGNPHPHASSEGKICFGKVDLEVKKYLAELEIAKLIKLLYSWAFSYNEEDSHIKLQKFYDQRMKENDTKHKEG